MDFSDQAGSAVSNETSIDDRIKAALSGGTDDDAIAVANQTPDAELEQGQTEEQQPAEETGAEELQESEPTTSSKLVAPDAPWEQLKDAKVKVPLKNGDTETEAEVTLDELRLGYMRTQDYHAKRQEDAGKVQKVQQEAGQYIQGVQQHFGKTLNELNAFVESLALGEFQGVDLNKLADENPAMYVKAKARLDQIHTARGAIQQHLQQLETQREAERKQRMNQAQAQFDPTLKSRIPNWGDELKERVAKHSMKSYGFTDKELSAITDPRVVEVLHDAFQFRSQPDKKVIAEKKVAPVPKVLTPGVKAGNQQASRDQQLKDRIRKSGGTDKAAIEERIRLRLR